MLPGLGIVECKPLSMKDLAIEETGLSLVQRDRSIVTKCEIEPNTQLGRSVDIENGRRSSDYDVDGGKTSHTVLEKSCDV
ncbi:hypothetical protein AA0117_g11932 [Alternaria alternata]|jgi:hypothetical protein|uniref:Uncharacterized protein n=2 Tax=Alternaria alternata complex TaxID=187734 RepID=A0A4Q4N2W9_ALTAL|nr:hypothetical protein AA0117_g11932 [Alternaria alternata]